MTNSTIETLDWLAAYWPDLVEARLPLATRRPTPPTNEISGEARELRDAEAHVERYFRTGLAWGESPAPLDVNVLQVVFDVLVAADDLAAELTEPSVCPVLPPPRLGQLDARPYLAQARARLLDEHHDLGEPGPWHEHADPIVYRMYEQVARALVMAYTGHVVRVLCPWCEGRTPETPVGGAYTWQVEEMPGQQVAIVCHGLCSPPEQVVGAWWGGQPCWPVAGWERLAGHVQASGARASGRVLLEMRRALGLAARPAERPGFVVGGRA